MSPRSRKSSAPAIHPRIRIRCGEDIAIGPGKAELLEHLQTTGSIAEAARRMDMSYMRAWKLIKTMNQCFREPLVVSVRGGTKGGGAQLSETGRQVLALYHQMEADCLEATGVSWGKMLQFFAN